MYKVFFNEQIIYIKSVIEDDDDLNYILINNAIEIPALLFDFFESEEDLGIKAEDPSEVLEWVKQELLYIEAAGGIVENDDEELLFIYRLEYWDLPKGKIENGESPEIAAYREIKEECGISSHQLKNHLCNTYHIYKQNGKMYLKKTFWFLFEQKDNSEELVPQTEENIEMLSWFGDDEIQLALLDSYESIREVYTRYKEVREA